PPDRKTFRQAALQIVVADVSMSLDNVLAVAGAAREHPYILAFGLLLSVAMMAVAANLIGRLIEKYRWIAYLGLGVILYVACDMIYRGTLEVAPAIGALLSIFAWPAVPVTPRDTRAALPHHRAARRRPRSSSPGRGRG